MFPVAMSIWVTMLSAISVIGVPVETYVYGGNFFLFAFSFFIIAPVIAHIFIPFFYKLQYCSVYEVSK